MFKRMNFNVFFTGLSFFYLLFLFLPVPVFARFMDVDPQEINLLSPSPFYSYVILSIVLVAIIILIIIYSKLGFIQKKDSFIKKITIILTPLFSGIIIFGIFPLFYRMFFNTCLENGITEKDIPKYIYPPLMGVSKITWGVLLVIIWFVLQPIVIQYAFQFLGWGNNRKLPIWPLYLFIVGISFWLIIAMLLPMLRS